MHPNLARARLKELTDEVARKTLAGTITKEFMDQVEAESEDLEITIKNYEKAKGMASYASPAEYGFADTDPDNGPAFNGFAPGMERQIRPTSIYEISKEQIGALKQAALNGTSFRVQIGHKGIESGNFTGTLRDKAAVTEGGLAGNLLPPIQQLGPMGFWGLPYELTRVANFLPHVAMDGPGIAYFKHTGNVSEASYVAEGALKPDLSPAISETYVRPAKVAGRVLLTHELAMDAGDAFSQNLVAELARSAYNAESNLLLNGTVATNGFDGINNVSGTLTRATGTDTGLDALNKAFVDLRNDFFVPDLVFIHPSTLGALRRAKDANSRYQLDLLAGAGAISGTNEEETLWGVRCCQTTQQAAGTAAVLSVQSGAAVIYVREAWVTMFDPYSQLANNIYQYVGETRIALATPRPQAINLVSGLPTS